MASKKTVVLKREKKIERAIRLVWDSLQSHLPYASARVPGESVKFHKQCIREYSEVISILSSIL